IQSENSESGRHSSSPPSSSSCVSVHPILKKKSVEAPGSPPPVPTPVQTSVLLLAMACPLEWGSDDVAAHFTWAAALTAFAVVRRIQYGGFADRVTGAVSGNAKNWGWDGAR